MKIVAIETIFTEHYVQLIEFETYWLITLKENNKFFYTKRPIFCLKIIQLYCKNIHHRELTQASKHQSTNMTGDILACMSWWAIVFVQYCNDNPLKRLSTVNGIV